MGLISSIKTRLFGLAVAADEAANVVIGADAQDVPAAGNPHFTVSQRVAQMRERGDKLGCWACSALTWIQNKIFRSPGDHCTQALEGFPDDLPTDG
jgi:hypothetical protein